MPPLKVYYDILLVKDSLMSLLGKTRRRIMDISGGFPGMVSDRTDQFLNFLESNSKDMYTRPWHKLERGVRLNRLRLFVEDEALRFQFSDEDKVTMFQVLSKALDKKQLNSGSIVIYDVTQQKILEIKGLAFHKQADGKIHFQIVERKSGTMRRKPAASVAPAEPKQSEK
jgi:hypothetical protein